MPLNDLKSAWNQMKLMHSMSSMEAEEIMAIIDQSSDSDLGKIRRLLINMILFGAIFIFLQGG